MKIMEGPIIKIDGDQALSKTVNLIKVGFIFCGSPGVYVQIRTLDVRSQPHNVSSAKCGNAYLYFIFCSCVFLRIYVGVAIYLLTSLFSL